MKTLDDTTPQNLREAHWLALPKLARVYSIVVGVPAVLWLFFQSDAELIETASDKVALAAFISVCAVQMVLIFRAYWRMDI